MDCFLLEDSLEPTSMWPPNGCPVYVVLELHLNCRRWKKVVSPQFAHVCAQEQVMCSANYSSTHPCWADLIRFLHGIPDIPKIQSGSLQHSLSLCLMPAPCSAHLAVIFFLYSCSIFSVFSKKQRLGVR